MKPGAVFLIIAVLLEMVNLELFNVVRNIFAQLIILRTHACFVCVVLSLARRSPEFQNHGSYPSDMYGQKLQRTSFQRTRNFREHDVELRKLFYGAHIQVNSLLFEKYRLPPMVLLG